MGMSHFSPIRLAMCLCRSTHPHVNAERTRDRLESGTELERIGQTPQKSSMLRCLLSAIYLTAHYCYTVVCGPYAN